MPKRCSNSLAALRETVRLARFSRQEAAGSLGDLGTFLPLLVGMAAQNGLDFAAGLFFAGLFSLTTGLAFAIPLAVQPMKAIAAVALTEGLTPGEIVAAGAVVSAVVLILGLTGLIGWLQRSVPKNVIRGLQLALGLSLLGKGLRMVAETHALFGPDSYFTALAALLLSLALAGSKRMPAALLLFLGGVVLAFWENPSMAASLRVGCSLPQWSPPTLTDFASSFFKAALPQIPLTTLNSVVAVSALATDLFGDNAAPPRRIAVSVGLMNLVAAWFGGMPMCHGAGGLAGQYRFGARTNGAILLLGGAKLIVAILFGASLMAVAAAFPASVLGVLLVFSGIELALVTRDQTRRRDAFAMLLTAGACLGLNNVALGFCLGLGVSLCLRLSPFRGEERATPATRPRR